MANKEDISKDIGKRIQTLRKSYKLTQQEFADKMNVSKNVIDKWEHGRIEIKASTIVKLSLFFKVSCEFLLRGINLEYEYLLHTQND